MYIDESPAYFYQERLELRSPTRGAATVLLTMTYIIRTFAVLVLAAGTAIAVKWGDDGQSFPDMSSNLRDTICVVIFFVSVVSAFLMYFIAQWAAVHAHAAHQLTER